LKLNLIQTPGIEVIQTAKNNGCWNALDDVENLICPDDLINFLSQQNLSQKWEAQSRSYKRGFLEFLLNSKRSETRAKKFSELKLYLDKK
jgi:uncharacterized protein YdeI (YjbR/CyaY-like superfamily)